MYKNKKFLRTSILVVTTIGVLATFGSKPCSAVYADIDDSTAKMISSKTGVVTRFTVLLRGHPEYPILSTDSDPTPLTVHSVSRNPPQWRLALGDLPESWQEFIISSPFDTCLLSCQWGYPDATLRSTKWIPIGGQTITKDSLAKLVEIAENRAPLKAE